MFKIAILDTSLCSRNLGNAIIMDAVNRQLHDIFGDAYIVRIPTHEVISRFSIGLIRDTDYAILGGTNLLSSNMHSYRQWRIDLLQSLTLKNIILMGVGWWQYQPDPNLYTRWLLRNVLHRSLLHSVRDQYTRDKLRRLGIENAINTGCPTLWDLSPEHCAAIPAEKAENALCCLTSYNQRKAPDTRLVEILRRNYRNLYFWIQSTEDYLYSKNIYDRFIYVDPSLSALDDLLRSKTDIDYVGTRLHAGIRAMQFKRRSIILSIDNRAEEMGRDFALPIVPREDYQKIEERIRAPVPTCVRVDHAGIGAWKEQFSPNAAPSVRIGFPKHAGMQNVPSANDHTNPE